MSPLPGRSVPGDRSGAFLCPWRHTTFGLALQRFEDVADSVHPTAAPDAGWSTCMSKLRFTRNRAAGVAQLIGSASPLFSSVSIWRAEGRSELGAARGERGIRSYSRPAMPRQGKYRVGSTAADLLPLERASFTPASGRSAGSIDGLLGAMAQSRCAPARCAGARGERPVAS